MSAPMTIIEQIEYYSYRYLSKKEIATIVEIDPFRLSDGQTEEGRAFLIGRYKRKAEFHDSIIKLSKQLSSPAMQIEHKIAEQVYINDTKIR